MWDAKTALGGHYFAIECTIGTIGTIEYTGKDVTCIKQEH